MVDIGTLSLIILLAMFALLAIGMPLGFASAFLAFVTLLLKFDVDILFRTWGQGPMSVLSQAVYAPDPKQSELQKTISARRAKKPGKNVTSFCVSTTGKVVDVKTKRKFPGDPQVDKICRDTVRKWRFKPFIVGGKATKTCSAAEFEISFK